MTTNADAVFARERIERSTLRKPRRGDRWARHHVDVASADTKRGERHQGFCTCGWRGALRVDPNDASNIAENHAWDAEWRRNGYRDI